MTISSSSVLDARARICERCCSYQHKKTRRRKSEPAFASSSSSSTTTKVAAAAVVVASSSTQRNDENERTTSTTTKTHSNRRAFLVSSTSLFSLCVAAIARYPLPSSKIAAHAATITIQKLMLFLILHRGSLLLAVGRAKSNSHSNIT